MDQFDFGGVEHDQEDPHATLKGNAEASATFMDGKLQMDKSILRSKQSSFELRRAASKPCRRLSESEIDAWTRNSKLIPKISSLLQPRGSSASAKTDSKLDLMVVSPVSVEEEDVTEPEGRLEGGVEGSSSNPRLKGLKSVFQRSSWLRKH
ncbi:hypothetical protein BC830DRAFT_1175762 [Chytriomyces sp. MP71]|nr:hypothetical protein BC830DRAFT_1175762 [Chytriomyces sp. MP71]